MAIAAGLIGRSATIAQIPRIFGPAMRGDLSPLAELVPEMSRRAEISAMSAAMDCASSASPQRRQEVSRQAETTILGTMVDFPNPQWCEAWGVSPLIEAFRTPVRATMPVLIIAGTLDGLTPVQNARDVLRGLTHGALITVVSGAHDNLADDSRVSRLVTQFLMGDRARDTTISLPQIRFETRVAAQQ